MFYELFAENDKLFDGHPSKLFSKAFLGFSLHFMFKVLAIKCVFYIILNKFCYDPFFSFFREFSEVIIGWSENE